MNFRQTYIFLIFIINGTFIGLLFDFFRILRKSFKTADIITYIEDIIFWILTGISLIYTIYIFGNGELRSFVLIGLILGFSIYLLTISKYIIKLSVIVINTLMYIIRKIFKILYYPLKIIFKIFKSSFYKINSIIKKIYNIKLDKKVKKLNLKRGILRKKGENII